MQYFIPAVCVLAGIAVLILLICYICYRMAFYAKRTPEDASGEFTLPPGEIYEPYHDVMRAWADETAKLPCRELEITSFDGLTLRGKYYEYAPGAPVELMFHGYRGNGERDMSGGIQRCFRVGRSALIVDQRSSGHSDGHVITMGIHECRDCLDWLDFAIRKFGPDCKIILTGISMGASTVLMAGGRELPENVIGILADCGYTSAKEILCTIMGQMKIPPAIGYPLAKLGAKLFGKFDLDADAPVEAVKKCRVPVIFFHGESDDYVPAWMSRANYEACASRKQLVLIPGAGHGLAFPVDQDGYVKALYEFFGPEASHPDFQFSTDRECSAR